jgi:hypothetical protein
MAFDESLIERYAMQAEQMIPDSASALHGIKVDDVSEAIGLSRDDGRVVAQYLKDIGWAIVSDSGELTLVLTFNGHKELALLRRATWRRWIDRHPIAMNVFWMTATSIVAGIVYTVIAYYMLK